MRYVCISFSVEGYSYKEGISNTDNIFSIYCWNSIYILWCSCNSFLVPLRYSIVVTSYIHTDCSSLIQVCSRRALYPVLQWAECIQQFYRIYRVPRTSYRNFVGKFKLPLSCSNACDSWLSWAMKFHQIFACHWFHPVTLWFGSHI